MCPAPDQKVPKLKLRSNIWAVRDHRTCNFLRHLSSKSHGEKRCLPLGFKILGSCTYFQAWKWKGACFSVTRPTLWAQTTTKYVCWFKFLRAPFFIFRHITKVPWDLSKANHPFLSNRRPKVGDFAHFAGTFYVERKLYEHESRHK